MRKLGFLFLLLAGCPQNTWESRVEDPGPLIPPPYMLLRKAPDFRIEDVNVGKEFFLYLYEDEEMKEEIIVVIDKKVPLERRTPRLASLAEHDYALELFEREWRTLGKERQVRYFNRMHDAEMARRATLLQDKIRYKMAEVEELDDKERGLSADLESRAATGTYAGGDEKFHLISSEALASELSKTRHRLLAADAQLRILMYQHGLMNRAFSRHDPSVYIVVTLKVDDLMPRYNPPGMLLREIRTKVVPEAWRRPDASISLSEDGQLEIRQTRDVALMVRDHIDQVRAKIAAEKEEPIAAPRR